MTQDHIYSSGVVDSSGTFYAEPDVDPTGLTAVSNGADHITVSWNDADADHYLVKGSKIAYSAIVPPVDGIAQADSLLVKNIDQSVQTYKFTGLTPATGYYFKIYPYNGSGPASNYKTDGNVPQASATTHELDLDLIISEVADPRDSSLAKFVEIANIGTHSIDFSTTTVYLCRQSNGGTRNSIRLTGTINAGGTKVLAYVYSPVDTLRFFNAYGFIPDQYSSYINGNGNDGYFLYFGGDHLTGYLFDSFGVLNEDGSGKPWEYTDKKAVRKRSVTGPNATWTASGWVISSEYKYAKDMTPGDHNGDYTWQGSSSTIWNAKGANWISPHGYIPDASSNVIIPNTANYPVITEPSSCNQVQLETGSVLFIQSSGSLKIVGQ
jgi:hypothetical protein